VLGHGGAGLILGRIGRRGGLERVGYVGFHVCISNRRWMVTQGLFSARDGLVPLVRGHALHLARCVATGGRV
jgi:hypothetical protein